MTDTFTDLESLMTKAVVTESGCWQWLLSKSSPYAHCQVGKRGMGAHRRAYEILVGEIPKGKLICHKCNNKKCVRPHPGHCYIGTYKENSQDMVRTVREGKQFDHWEANRERCRLIRTMSEGKNDAR